MMDVTLRSGAKVLLIGDPHMGRSFEAGVPLDRRGEREARQLTTFKAMLDSAGYDYIVVMGDLFDHPYVSFAVVLDVYKALVNAASAHPSTCYVVYSGNHDVPRNIEAVGAFNMLEAMCHMRVNNLYVTTHPAQVGVIAVYPWQWQFPAAKQQIITPVTTQPVEMVAGHWDLFVFGENTDHLAPTKVLREAHGDVPLYTGHVHVPGLYVVDGEEVVCTGSMEPYSHGEDPEGKIYVTLTPAQLEQTDPSELRDKCVRVLLAEGDEMPTGIDCLALTPKRVAGEQEAIELLPMRAFNWSDILEKKLADLPEPVQNYIRERLVHE